MFEVGDVVQSRGTVESVYGQYRLVRYDFGRSAWFKQSELELMEKAKPPLPTLPEDGIYRDRVGDLWRFRAGRGEPLTVGGFNGQPGWPSDAHDRKVFSHQVHRWGPYTEVK